MTVPSDQARNLPDCSAKAERATSFSVVAMVGLETAAEILGSKVRLADALGIDTRSLWSKRNADRGISRLDLDLAAKALDRLAVRAAAHAVKLRDAAGTKPPVDPAPLAPGAPS